MLKPLAERMNKRQVDASFKEGLLPHIDSVCRERSGTTDRIAQWEAWNNYTDSLCKDGLITDWQYHNWANPYG